MIQLDISFVFEINMMNSRVILQYLFNSVFTCWRHCAYKLCKTLILNGHKYYKKSKLIANVIVHSLNVVPMVSNALLLFTFISIGLLLKTFLPVVFLATKTVFMCRQHYRISDSKLWVLATLVINCLANLHSRSTLVRFMLSYFFGRVLPFKKIVICLVRIWKFTYWSITVS